MGELEGMGFLSGHVRDRTKQGSCSIILSLEVFLIQEVGTSVWQGTVSVD